jgi:hypothetical protein
MSQIWLIVGKEVDGNTIKNYIFMNNSGNTQFVQRRSLEKFMREHEVINAQINGDTIVGRGISLNALPRYIKDNNFGLQQVGGLSQNEIIQQSQPLIAQYNNKKALEEQRKTAQGTDAILEKRNAYIENKLNIISSILSISLAMKDITNEMATNGQFTRYLKQIDIDNAEGDSLTKLIQRQGVNGLANGIEERLNRLSERVTKFSLNKDFKVKIKELKSDCNTLREMHADTKKIISNNKKQEELEEENAIEIIDEEEDLSDAIEIASEDLSDAIEIASEDIEDAIEIISEEEDLSDAIALEAEEEQKITVKLDKEEQKSQNEQTEVDKAYERCISKINTRMQDQEHMLETAKEAIAYYKKTIPGSILNKTNEEILGKYTKKQIEDEFSKFSSYENINRQMIENWFSMDKHGYTEDEPLFYNEGRIIYSKQTWHEFFYNSSEAKDNYYNLVEDAINKITPIIKNIIDARATKIINNDKIQNATKEYISMYMNAERELRNTPANRAIAAALFNKYNNTKNYETLEIINRVNSIEQIETEVNNTISKITEEDVKDVIYIYTNIKSEVKLSAYIEQHPVNSDDYDIDFLQRYIDIYSNAYDSFVNKIKAEINKLRNVLIKDGTYYYNEAVEEKQKAEEEEKKRLEAEKKAQEEELTITDVLNELFFSGGEYAHEKSITKGITDEYRSWDKFTFKEARIITIIYKGINNTFKVEATIPPIFRVKTFNYTEYKFPGDYTVKINRYNLDKARESLRDYIDTTLSQYAKADEMLSNFKSKSANISSKLEAIYRKISTYRASYEMQNILSIGLFDYIDKTENYILSETKNLLRDKEMKMYDSTYSYSIKEVFEHIKDDIQREQEKAQSNIKEKKRKLQEQEKKQIHLEKEQAKQYEQEESEQKDIYTNEFKDTLRQKFENINSEIGLLQKHNLWSDGENTDPFVYKTCTVLKDIEKILNKHIGIGNVFDSKIFGYSINLTYYAAGDEYFDRIQNETCSTVQETLDILVNVINDINYTRIAGKLSEKFKMAADELEMYKDKVDDSDRFYSGAHKFMNHYDTLIGGDITTSYGWDKNRKQGSYNGIKGQMQKLIEALEDKASEISRYNKQFDGVEWDTSETPTYTSASPEEIREALEMYPDI